MRIHTVFIVCVFLCSAFVMAQQTDDYADDNVIETETTAVQTQQQPETAVSELVAPAVVTPAPLVKAPIAADNSGQRPTAGLGLGKMALSLAIVVAIVLVLGWTFKKLTLRMPGSRHIKIISSMPIGPKERLLVIEMQGKQRVLGVTSNSINLLFELENSLPEEKLASDFHTQLQSLLKK